MGSSLNLWQGVSQADGGDNYRYPEDNDDIGEFASLHPREHIINDVQRSEQTEQAFLEGFLKRSKGDAKIGKKSNQRCCTSN
jgi:hypothetical protein